MRFPSVQRAVLFLAVLAACPALHANEAELAQRVGGAYKGLFYLNDFSYLQEPGYNDWHLGEDLKQLALGNGVLDIGGQLRLRHHHERGMKGATRFLPGDDNFLLTRLRLFANYQANDWLSLHFETIYADSSGESFPPRVIDENFMDILNGLARIKLTEELSVDLGRHELLYGDQRVISPLDWANTRRTFEGARVRYASGDVKIDGFFTHLVPPRPTMMDEANYDLPFYGIYGTYGGFENATVDSYYLGADNNLTGQSLHTFGGRLKGNVDNLLYDLEGAIQTGKRAGGVTQNGETFVTVGLGRAMPNVTWTPTVWVYYDYASENYNQLFPLAHKYLGFIDAVARRNIEAPNLLFTLKPHERVQFLLWYYHFMSNTAAPVISIGGTPPQNGHKHFGDELDLLVNMKVDDRSSVLFGYSYFWRGDKILNSSDAEFFYMHYLLNF